MKRIIPILIFNALLVGCMADSKQPNKSEEPLIFKQSKNGSNVLMDNQECQLSDTTRIKLKYDDYRALQTGLYNIYCQLPYDTCHMITNWNIDEYKGTEAMPYIFYLDHNDLGLKAIDTLRFNWKSDTIICINSYSLCNSRSCSMLSSTDTLTYIGGLSIPITHTKTIGIESDFMYNVIRDWNQWDIDDFLLTDLYSIANIIIYDSDKYSINRIIINNGKIVDFKHKPHIDYIPTDTADMTLKRYHKALQENFKNLRPISK